jgi:ABC-type branched-subunit amino acid transport system permease subunit
MFLFLAMVIIGGRQSLAGCVTGAIGSIATATPQRRRSDTVIASGSAASW